LIDYIVNTHHAYLRKELPKLSEYTFKILKVHGKQYEELFRVHRPFNNLRTEMEEHFVNQEEFVFPLVKNYEKTKDFDIKYSIINLINELESDLFQHIHLENNILFINI
jgi:regulator of cell morphogenesis and NO signaling